MLKFEGKVKIFTSIMNQEEVSYADSYNATIDIYASNFDYNFLEKLQSREDIELWIAKLKSRIIMKEDEDTLEDIVNDYILCG